jgi:hypothetical protein
MGYLVFLQFSSTEVLFVDDFVTLYSNLIKIRDFCKVFLVSKKKKKKKYVHGFQFVLVESVHVVGR